MALPTAGTALSVGHTAAHGAVHNVLAHYGAVGDGLTDDSAAIDAAVTAAAAATDGGTVYLPPGRYLRGSTRMALPDGVSIVGAGSHASTLYFTGSPTDSLIYASRRDDNNANNADYVNVSDLGVDCQSASMSGKACLDLTGFRHSTFQRLYLNGPGIASGAVMIRMADRNPANTSQKSTFFNSIRNIQGDGAGWGKGVTVKQVDGNCNSNNIEQIACYCAIGYDFTGNLGSLNTRIASSYFSATGTATDIVGTLAEQQNVDYAQMDFEGFTTNNIGNNWKRVRNISAQELFHTNSTTVLYTEYLNSNGKTVRFGNNNRPYIHGYGVPLLEGTGDAGFGESPGIRINSLAHVLSGTGAPNGVVIAPVGSLWLRSDGGASTTLYVKESGVGSTGWVAK